MKETRKLNLRLPPDLYEQAAELAAYQCTSLNALAVAALRSWIEFQSKIRGRGAIAPKPSPALGRSMTAPSSIARAERRERGEASEPSLRELETVRRDAPKVGPNEPCPCGSGAKFKRCHGQPGRA